MLVLSRRLQESVLIGDDIKVTIVELGQGKVRLAIDAPRDVLIIREELKATWRDKAPEKEPTKEAS